jgi:hypothetical protein
LLCVCAIAAFYLALVAGCAAPNELCAARGGALVPDANNEAWDSEAQRRAAVAIECDAQEIQSRISSAVGESDLTAMGSRARELAELAIEAVRVQGVESSRLPLSSAHQEMYEVAAEAERASGSPAFLAWVTNPWKPLHPLERPRDAETAPLSIALMPGERRALAVNVRSTSVTNSKLRVWVNVIGFRHDAIQLYQVNWTGDDRSKWAAAELELLGDATATREASVLPGVTRQIWLEVHPDMVAVPGNFVGNVSLSTDDGQTADVPIEIKVFATRFDRPSMHFGGWDYSFSTNYAALDTTRSQFVQYLQARYVDTPWEQRHSQMMHWQNLDASGNAVAPLDSSAMERWIAQWPNARRYRVFLHVDDHIAGIPTTNPRFAHAVTTWANAWATEIRRLNKSPEQFDLLLVDEPQTDEQDRTTEAWATAIRHSGTGFRIWTDLVWRDPLAIPESLFDAVDTVAVYMGFAESQERWRHELWARTFSERGKTLELYAFDGPARRLDPHTYYRLTPWRAFFMGASAVSFWSFADTGASSPDNEFAAHRVNYSPLFVNDEMVRPGKHMEAAAQGIQDVHYLEMLDQVVSSHPDETVRLQAQQLLHDAAVFVYDSPPSTNAQWESQGPTDGADKHRVRIAEFLDSLSR